MSSENTADRASSTLPARTLVFPMLVVLVLVSFALARWWPAQSSAGDPPLLAVDQASVPNSAAWIWARTPEPEIELPLDAETPLAFWLVRDFELSAEQASAGVELHLASDADVLVQLNGLWLGALAGDSDTVDPRAAGSAAAQILFGQTEAWRAPVAQQRFDLDTFSRAGRNRLLLQVRSLTGNGAVLGELRSGADGGTLLATTGLDWLVARRTPLGLRDGWLDLRAAAEVLEAPAVWGRPPIGRYELRDAAQLPRSEAFSPLDVEAVPALEVSILPENFDFDREDGIAERALDRDREEPRPRSARTRWESPTTGYLYLEFDRPPHRVEVRATPPSTDDHRSAGAGWRRLVVSDDATWRDAAVRTYERLDLRYWGAALRAAAVHPLDGR